MTQTSLVQKLQTEGVIGTAEAARVAGGFLPVVPHPATVFRWISRGVMVNGVRVKLEAIRAGARLMTSAPAVQRFFEAQNTSVADQKSATETAASQSASRELDALLAAV